MDTDTLINEIPASFENLDTLFRANSFQFDGKVIPGSLVKTLLSLPGPRGYKYNPKSGMRYGREFSMDSLGSETPKIVDNSKAPAANYSEINSDAIDYLQHYFSLPANSSKIKNIKDLIPSLSFHIAGNMGPYLKFLELKKTTEILNSDKLSNGFKGHLCWLLSAGNYGAKSDEVSNLIVNKINEDGHFKGTKFENLDININNYYETIDKNIGDDTFLSQLDRAYESVNSDAKGQNNQDVLNNLRIDAEMFESFSKGASSGGSRKKVFKKNNKTKKGGYLKRKRTSRKSHSKKSMKNKKHKKSNKNKKSRKSRKTKKSTKRNNNNNNNNN